MVCLRNISVDTLRKGDTEDDDDDDNNNNNNNVVKYSLLLTYYDVYPVCFVFYALVTFK
jgi:hypothetical protein